MKSRLVVFLSLCFCVFILITECSREAEQDVRGPEYAGSNSCQSCHSDQFEQSFHEAHAMSSKEIHLAADLPDLPSDTFFFNDRTFVPVERNAGGLEQLAVVNGEIMKREHAAMLFGSGKYAYTFAFWNGQQLMQMPLNYLVAEQEWVNSPGFPQDQIYYGRVIQARCLECHASFAESRLQVVNGQVQDNYKRESVLSGIDCERCHGPAKQHVDFQRDHPETKEARHITSYASLSRDQRMDMCGSCHSGFSMQFKGDAFRIKPGDTVRALPSYNEMTGAAVDVHGYQKQALMKSACFPASQMECISCHQIHETDKSLLMYSKDCQSCHQDLKHPDQKGMTQAALSTNCIECHMPLHRSGDVGFQRSGSKEQYPYSIRTHEIKIYRDLINQ